MSFDNVFSRVVFWDAATAPWSMPNLQPGVSVASTTSQSFKNSIESYLESLYNNSATARSLFNDVVSAGGFIRIGDSGSNPGFSAPAGTSTDAFIGIGLSGIANLGYFNNKGTWVAEKPELTVIHELFHNLEGTWDPGNPGHPAEEADQNTAEFEFRGPTIALQNIVAVEMGFTDNIQTAYLASAEVAKFVAGKNYTDGENVEYARIGDSDANNIDMSLRTDSSRDLLFGLGGNDVIKGGGGNDHLYGNDGNDILVGGQGNDRFWGEDGNDTIWGGLIDVENSADGEQDTVSYSLTADPISVSVSAQGVTTIQDGQGGTDTLHSIEKIVGTAARDTFTVLGTIKDGMVLTFDAFGGQSANDLLNLAQLNNGIHLVTDGSNGTLKNKEGGGTGVIKLLNFNTTIMGTSFNDDITDSSPEAKVIHAGMGNDSVRVSGGRAQVSGGAGSDTLLVTQGTASLSGDAGDDLLIGSDGNDTLSGGSGADLFEGGAGADNFYVGDGDVILDIDADDRVWGFGAQVTGGWQVAKDSPMYWDVPDDLTYIWDGSTTLNVSTWDDVSQTGREFTIEGFQNGDGGIWLTFWDGIPPPSDEGIPGTPGDDAMQGTPGDDKLRGDGGNDTLVGGAGDDTLDGGDGDDTFMVSAGDGSDSVAGGAGFDTILATGNNVTIGLRSIQGVDRISPNGFSNVTVGGTSNNDVFVLYGTDMQGIAAVTGGAGDDTIYGGAGNENILGDDGKDRLFGAGGNDTLIGGAGDDALDGGDGDDTFFIGSGSGFDQVSGGDGSDTLAASAASAVLGLSRISGVETITASGHANVTVRGTNLGDVLDFRGVSFVGITQIDAAGGNDTLTGNEQANVLLGGSGNDTLAGAGGNDTLDGGDGDDTFLIGPSEGFYTILGGAGADTIAATANGTVIGLSSVNEVQTFTANGFTDVSIRTRDTSETWDFYGAAMVGITQIDVGGGDDIIYGNTEVHRLRGGSGNDEIYAQEEDDELFGDAGDDILSGWYGNDTYDGGSGNDYFFDEFGDATYYYRLGDGYDAIDEMDGFDVLVFGAGITAADVTTSIDGDDFVFTLSSGGEVRVIWGTDAEYAVDEVRFADNTVWDFADLYGAPAAASAGTWMEDTSLTTAHIV